MRISVCIPTFRNREGVLRAARSVFAQVGLTEFDVELVVIDNSPEGSALAALKRLQSSAPIPMKIAHERRVGEAHARRAALKVAAGDLVAWLEDGQEASALWLDRLVGALRELRAGVVFGPIAASAPESADRAYFEEIHARRGPKENVLLVAPLGVGNSMMRRSAMPETCAQCDVEELVAGAVYGWAAGARVTEHVPPAQATLDHAVRRAFLVGQAPSASAARRGDFPALAGHVFAGAMQAMWYGVSAGLAWLVRAPSRMELTDRAMRGVGRALWFRRPKPHGAA